MEFSELGALVALSEELSIGDVTKLQSFLDMPVPLVEESSSSGIQFLATLKSWVGHSPFRFYQAISATRPDLIPLAMKIPWLCVAYENEEEYLESQLTIKSFISLLKKELKKRDLAIIYIMFSSSIVEVKNIEMTLSELVNQNFIQRDLQRFSNILEKIKRKDLAIAVKKYEKVFLQMEEEEFLTKLRIELTSLSKEKVQWAANNKQFMKIMYQRVQILLGRDEFVSLDHVYVDLAIVENRRRTGSIYSEIPTLKSIDKKEGKIQEIDFTEKLKSLDAATPEILCLIGNIGCGKTFLAKRTALRYSQGEIPNIFYSLAISCSNKDWHTMESVRHEENEDINPEFVQEWMNIGLPVGSSWPKDLTKHLTESDGEGLLLIIDGLDEFSSEIPFPKSFLCSLLTRNTLTRSNILLTTRPGAWIDLSSKHNFKIDKIYQILGFLPQNVGEYFNKQFENRDKFEICISLLERYEEINLLSLIPVNASLFASLVKDESLSLSNLTKLYMELTGYLIKSHLSRMGLKSLFQGKEFHSFPQAVTGCLNSIGRLALMSVANEEVNLTGSVELQVGTSYQDSKWLGLANEYSEKSSGYVCKVWSFVHLSIHEFTSAIYMKSISWTNQCLSIRYIVTLQETFLLFRRVIRFLCGLLTDRSSCLLTILYSHMIPETKEDLSSYSQSGYDTELLTYTGWYDSTKRYIQLTEILFETNVPKISDYFTQLQLKLVAIYFHSQVFPISQNEWYCFTESLKCVNRIHVVSVESKHINLRQFKDILSGLRNCGANHLAINFEQQDSTTILEYIDLLVKSAITSIRKICIQLTTCILTDSTTLKLFSSIDKVNLTDMRLNETTLSNTILNQIASTQLSSLNYLSLKTGKSKDETYDILFPALNKATQLRGLYLHSIPRKYHQEILQIISQFPELKEISLENYSLLPQIQDLLGIKYLHITDSLIEDQTLSNTLLQVIKNSNSSLRELKLGNLELIGIRSWGIFLTSLRPCVKLVLLELSFIYLPLDEITQWSTVLYEIRSLVQLKFSDVSLYDAGVMDVCGGVAVHPSIRYLSIQNCQQTSESCETLRKLIPLVNKLEMLIVNNLTEPDDEPIKQLREITKEYSISFKECFS